jgi:hypothetical protein
LESCADSTGGHRWIEALAKLFELKFVLPQKKTLLVGIQEKCFNLLALKEKIYVKCKQILKHLTHIEMTAVQTNKLLVVLHLQLN